MAFTISGITLQKNASNLPTGNVTFSLTMPNGVTETITLACPEIFVGNSGAVPAMTALRTHLNEYANAHYIGRQLEAGKAIDPTITNSLISNPTIPVTPIP